MVFTLNEKALPFPLTEKDGGFKLVPFVADLNQQTLRVSGLEAGKYEIRIDGAPVAQVEAKEIAAGVNLATNEKTPQYQAALKIRELISPEKKALERAERDLAVTMLSIGPAYNWETDDETARQELEKWIAGLKNTKGWTGYLIAQNRKLIPQRGEIKTKLAQLRKQLAATPREFKHLYEIVRVTTGN